MTKENDTSNQEAQVLFQERIQRVNDAIALKEGDRVPFAPFISALPYFLYGGTYRDGMYNYEKASEAILAYYHDFKPDADIHPGFTSGRANELAGSTMIDWPGRPGTRVPDFSTHQVIEHEYMSQEEYPEFINDFMGFNLRKYIPRAFPNLKGLAQIRFVPSIVLSTTPLSSFYSPEVQEAFSILKQIGEEDAKAVKAGNELSAKIAAMGIPPMMTGVGEAPFDIIGDYYRGTLGALTDQIECPDMIEKACDMLADMQIASYEYFKAAPLPVKRVFFPLHKGMDGFMSPEQYKKLYWKPLKKIMLALIDMGVTPFIYTEGRYDSRLEQLADVPAGKVIYHFETVDMARAKKVLGDIACISGNLPIYLLEYGTKQQVIDACKALIDTCAPGGGYIFDANGSIDNAKRENIEAMYDTVLTYGKK